jgi:hypothetical protein
MAGICLSSSVSPVLDDSYDVLYTVTQRGYKEGFREFLLGEGVSSEMIDRCWVWWSESVSEGDIMFPEDAELLKAGKEVADEFDNEWKLEMAMEAGMAFGCRGYNDVMGF